MHRFLISGVVVNEDELFYFSTKNFEEDSS